MAVELGIVVRRVVVERDQALRAGQPRQVDRVLDPAVTPAHALLVLLGRVLRVVDQQVGAPAARSWPDVHSGLSRRAVGRQRRLVVGQVGHVARPSEMR